MSLVVEVNVVKVTGLVVEVIVVKVTVLVVEVNVVKVTPKTPKPHSGLVISWCRQRTKQLETRAKQEFQQAQPFFLGSFKGLLRFRPE